MPPFRLTIRVRLLCGNGVTVLCRKGASRVSPNAALQPLRAAQVLATGATSASAGGASVLVALTLATGCGGGGSDFSTGSCASIRAHIRQHSDIGDGSDLYVWWDGGSAYWSDNIDDIPDLANTRWMSLYWLADERC